MRRATTRDAGAALWETPAARSRGQTARGGGEMMTSTIAKRTFRYAHESHPSSLKDRDTPMTIHLALQPLLALIAGILILVMPRLLNFIVAIYLIVVGLTGILNL
jgi:hypothetical protein